MMNFVDPTTREKKRMYIGYLTKKPIPRIDDKFSCYNGTQKSNFSLTPWDKFHMNYSQEEINELSNYLQNIFGYKTIVKKNSDIHNENKGESYIIDNSDCQSFLPVYFNSNEFSKIRRFQDKLWGLLCVSLEFKMNKETDDMYYILPFYKSLDQEDSKINVDWYYINYILQEKANPDEITVADWIATVDYHLQNNQKDIISPTKSFEDNYNAVRDTFEILKKDPSFKEEYKTRNISQENKSYISDTLHNTYFRTLYNRRLYILKDFHEELTMDDEFTVKNYNKDEEPYQISYKNYIMKNYSDIMENYEYKYPQFSLVCGKVFSLLKNFDYHSEKELEVQRRQKENKSKKEGTGFKAWFIPELCHIFHLPTYWLKFLQYIPILTYKLKAFCYISEFRYVIGIKPLSIINLTYAATSKNSDIIMGNRHEQLEMLGDTILKYLTTIYYYNRYPEKDESFLTSIRMKNVSNENLIQLTNYYQWNRFFLQKKFSINYFHPPNISIIEGMRIRECSNAMHENKPIADFFESIIGACFIEGKTIAQGIQICQLFLSRSKLIIPIPFNYKPTIDEYVREPGYDYDEIVKKICKFLNHTYSKDSTLYTVLHLISLATPTMRREYQRLEYLGDAVIDLITINYFFNRFKGANPKELTQFKHLSVQNQVFADIIYNFGLIECLPFPPSTKKEIDKFIEMKSVHKDFPFHKNIADLFEVFVGAIHIDNGYQFEKTNEELVDFLTKHIFQHSAQNQSIERFEVINEIIEILSVIGRKYSHLEGFLRNPKSVYQ
ncbi:ribonuclease III [Piromyces finnis]|uniref:Ribonuclease III n=1 Tax=Piromyces finnis TaxID=1754191 RepID=A0A1Y1VDS7_9FUNG|nr:ribonuclease III [Piromyces finnis]|eukprot:ORX52934.1 ribonuclease III [Piromyces finnis]